MRKSKWFNKLVAELRKRKFAYHATASQFLPSHYVKDDTHVYIRRDGRFTVTFPDGHSGYCAAGSTKNPVEALAKALDSYRISV